MGVDGLRFVITGGAVGIGAGTARLAAARGARVVVADLNDDAGEALVQEICATGQEAVYQHCDVTDEQQVQALMQAAADAFGGIDILHNNAGIHESMLTSQLSLEEMSRDTFEKVMGVNVTGVWLAAKYALPFLRESDNASIINAGSTSSLSGYPQCQAYGASKGAVMQLSKMLAVDLAADGIRVNCYCPGSIHTQIVDKFLEASPDPQAMLNTMTLTHLVPRMGQPADVAELVCFLASPESKFVNGAVWTIDGGSLAWRGTLDILGMEAQA
ncbi:SDR family oxidoreductase [Pseudohalioglobus sediminis]|uniref:SDR family oxidoreductase n=1 Tax=Pseudohalioglobus sediminis TaxID=2606449 RepID=A0A5B0X1C5_9GAMM|nr:SDR family NAD(P)-dependent oxidoreductase [Pseudohalioglobus sediminis]KAA1192367.1 SDR family oxidoreductase [Pseudohalioglobus sediminis]